MDKLEESVNSFALEFRQMLRTELAKQLGRVSVGNLGSGWSKLQVTDATTNHRKIELQTEVTPTKEEVVEKKKQVTKPTNTMVNSYILQGDFFRSTIIMLRSLLSFRGLHWKRVLLLDVFVGVVAIVFLKILILVFGLFDQLQLVQSKAKLADEEIIIQIKIIAAIELKRKIIVGCFLQCGTRKEHIFGSEYVITRCALDASFAYDLWYVLGLLKHTVERLSEEWSVNACLEELFDLTIVKMILLHSSLLVIPWDRGKHMVVMVAAAYRRCWKNSPTIYCFLKFVYDKGKIWVSLLSSFSVEMILDLFSFCT